MRAEEHARRALELANRYYAPAMRAANQGFSVYDSLQPRIQQLLRQVRDAEDFPRYLLITSFTFARGGWHDAPLAEASARGIRVVVDELADKPDEEVRARLDHDIPEYFRENDYAALRDMVERWDLFEDRRRMFEDAFEAHCDGKYTLSMPALAPQVEGMLRDISGEYDNNSQYMWKINGALNFSYDRREPPPPATTVKDLEVALDSLLDQDFRDRHEIADRISLRHALLRVNELYEHVNFADLEFVDPANRHVILHGVGRDFSELASTKLFCAVQLVHEVALAYEEATRQEPS